MRDSKLEEKEREEKKRSPPSGLRRAARWMTEHEGADKQINAHITAPEDGALPHLVLKDDAAARRPLQPFQMSSGGPEVATGGLEQNRIPQLGHAHLGTGSQGVGSLPLRPNPHHLTALKIGLKMNLSYTIRDEIRGKGLGDLYLGDWRTELFF